MLRNSFVVYHNSMHQLSCLWSVSTRTNEVSIGGSKLASQVKWMDNPVAAFKLNFAYQAFAASLLPCKSRRHPVQIPRHTIWCCQGRSSWPPPQLTPLWAPLTCRVRRARWPPCRSSSSHRRWWCSVRSWCSSWRSILVRIASRRRRWTFWSTCPSSLASLLACVPFDLVASQSSLVFPFSPCLKMF